MTLVRYEQIRHIAVLSLNNPPVNALAYELRRDLAAALDRALTDACVQGIVLAGTDKAFCAGADIPELGTPKAAQDPNIFTLIREIENSRKPVVAAIAGICMGGGLEIALACHYRVALSDAQIAFPEIKLGLMPGAGGTQRLPRLTGLQWALNLMLTGEAVRAERLMDTALFDRVVASNLVEQACAVAMEVVDAGVPPRRTCDLKVDEPYAQSFLQVARNTVRPKLKGGDTAALRVIDAVAASVDKPFEDGLRLEREAFATLEQAPYSRAMRHIFRAERLASKVDGVPSHTPVRDIRRVAIIGAGTMGGGIAMAFLNVGIPVILLDRSDADVERGLANVRRNYEATVQRGRLTAEAMEQRMAQLTGVTEYSAIADADLVIEAVFENMDVKEDVFKKLDAVMKPGAILASNTSRLDVDRIAAFTQRPADVLGMHFFSPANVMKLLEVVRGAQTAPDVLNTVMQLARRIGKVAIVSGVCDGFIGNRMITFYLEQSMVLLEEGASPQQIDRALEKWGMAMGPFRMSDLAGLDIGYTIRQRQYAEDAHARRSPLADKVFEAGRLGQKNGKGWYKYVPGQRNALRDPEVDALIAEHFASAGRTPRTFSDEEIVERCIYALVNEGAYIMQEGIAARASDIDLVYLHGYGFPRWRGGPMMAAQTVGLSSVVRAIQRIRSRGDSWFKEPAPLLVQRAEQNLGLD
ncbi:3-hydroxyacyl-CoA dehydrogenase NAD-binding domain-containing protein [Hydrogenophaga sp. BPS33]|uniref:3-hydroxyacyl-CoA dehydrogenase NAD-binding domain-containing protein n=1 Tax=Hydrogenophaga sp. BPS33 TaxID=2651974 RepID=UPI00131F6EBD|nr:3-hydroxyacyl-CoA dehydrogenase NAD-binding domain-containing protein [Hydrogenophaga sp. BPS33]QHE83920.1 3-hydroxyacyl-CoA dehydrogenase [Hydrogenophaga sp. BPS33]